MKEDRAAEIASTLSNNEKWHSHGRGIGILTLREELKLKIEDFGKKEEIQRLLRKYFHLIDDYMYKHRIVTFVHHRE
jgi:hypothetical protein